MDEREKWWLNVTGIVRRNNLLIEFDRFSGKNKSENFWTKYFKEKLPLIAKLFSSKDCSFNKGMYGGIVFY